MGEKRPAMKIICSAMEKNHRQRKKTTGNGKKTLGNGEKRSAMEKKFRYGNNLGKLLQNISLNLS
jgi:hypothetical protein